MRITRTRGKERVCDYTFRKVPCRYMDLMRVLLAQSLLARDGRWNTMQEIAADVIRLGTLQLAKQAGVEIS